MLPESGVLSCRGPASQMRVLWASEAQWHALALGAFASILAPYGGFFASGLKRALQIKVRTGPSFR